MTQLLFSYGTLQQRDVQLATFGRALSGLADELVGFRQSLVRITDPEVIRTSGKDRHPIVRQTGVEADRVAGTVFEITEEELANADRYEVSDYQRVSAPLASGRTAWVYVEARGVGNTERLDRPTGGTSNPATTEEERS